MRLKFTALDEQAKPLPYELKWNVSWNSGLGAQEPSDDPRYLCPPWRSSLENRPINGFNLVRTQSGDKRQFFGI